MGKPGSNGRDGITCVFVRKIIDLAFKKNLMRANAVDFKKCIIGVVDFVEPEHVPVLVVMNGAEGTSSGAGASMTAACSA